MADPPTGHLELTPGKDTIKMLAASDRIVYLTDGRSTDRKKRSGLHLAIGTIAEKATGEKA